MAEQEVAAILKSSDVARTIDWYQRAGFELIGTFADEQMEWAALGRDGLVLHFMAGATPWDEPPSSQVASTCTLTASRPCTSR